MGWLADCSESERASILAKLAGRAYLSEAELKATEKTLKMQRSKGTEPTKFSDILADLKTIPGRHPRAGRVHQGFKEYTDLVFDEIITHVKKVRKKNENVFVVGHSLGGAMAVLVAEGLSHAGIPIKELRTFGQPRVGNAKFRRHLEGCDIGRYVRYVNNNDIVTSVPPSIFGFTHGGNLHYINYHGNIRNFTVWQRVKDGWRGFWAAVKEFKFFDFVADHGMPNYVEKAGNIAKIDK
jgi:hypothetical protein